MTEQKEVKLSGGQFVYVDIGARESNFCFWKIDRRQEQSIHAVLYECEDVAASKLEEIANNCHYKSVNVIRKGVWSDSGLQKLYVTKAPGCTSMMQPIDEFDSLFLRPGNFKVENTEYVDCDTVDNTMPESLLSLPKLVKIDIEGAELECLKGMAETINTCIAVQVEVNFMRYRHKQATFGEIHDWMLDRGFLLANISGIGEYRLSGGNKYQGFSSKNRLSKRFPFFSHGFTCSGDALYLKDPRKVSEELTADYIEICNRLGFYDIQVYLNKTDQYEQQKFFKNDNSYLIKALKPLIKDLAKKLLPLG